MKNPLDDDQYTGNDEQIADLKDVLIEMWRLLGIAVAVIENEYPETEDPYKIVARYAELKQQLEEEK